MKDSRLATFEILCSILRDGAYSNIAVDKGINSLEKKDKAFVSRIVYGVIERKLSLDYILEKNLNGKTKPKLKILLYIGAYQILFMDKVPDAVAVFETVKLADSVGLSYYKGLINAVLHKVIDNKDFYDNTEDLSIKYSCPAHLINMWRKMYGEKNLSKILTSMNNRAPIFAVPNTKYVDADELFYELTDSGVDCEVFDDVVKINSSFDLDTNRAFLNGLFYIEDYSCYRAVKEFNVSGDEIVFDMCSAPGGKAFGMALSVSENAKIYAFDIHQHRVELINKTSKRLDIKNIISSINDATEYNPNLPKANKILCDVPCSGFGIIRRKPEIKYKNLDDIKELPDVQYNILETSSKYLLAGGRIMYSTCTLNKKENEKVVEKFLDNHSNFKLINEVTIFPDSNAGDGFFYAIMEKIDE